MNKKGHVLNGLLLGIGITTMMRPVADSETAILAVEVTVPVVLGALFPDVDTAFGTHRKTLHNLPTLATFFAFPLAFGNLQYVWVGVLTHYVLDVIGSERGIALFYPYPEEYGFPTGVDVDSKWASVATFAVTVLELVAIAAVVHYELTVGDLQTAASAFL